MTATAIQTELQHGMWSDVAAPKCDMAWLRAHLHDVYKEDADSYAPTAMAQLTRDYWTVVNEALGKPLQPPQGCAVLPAPTTSWSDAAEQIRATLATADALSKVRVNQLARRTLHEGVAPMVMRVPIKQALRPESLKQGALEFWIQITPDANNIERSHPRIYVIKANLVHVPEGSDATALAVLHAHYLPEPCMDRFSLDQVTDAHSFELHTAYQVALGGPLAAAQRIRGEFKGAGICVPWVIIDEPYRGEKLFALMLDQLANATRWPDDFVIELRGRPYPEEDDDEGPFFDELEYLNEDLPLQHLQGVIGVVDCNPITLFLLQIPDQAPDEITRLLRSFGSGSSQYVSVAYHPGFS